MTAIEIAEGGVEILGLGFNLIEPILSEAMKVYIPMSRTHGPSSMT